SLYVPPVLNAFFKASKSATSAAIAPEVNAIITAVTSNAMIPFFPNFNNFPTPFFALSLQKIPDKTVTTAAGFAGYFYTRTSFNIF
ncbi:MAG: hypothetical protein RRY12_01005, partial [Cloacibacillus sp.]